MKKRTLFHILVSRQKLPAYTIGPIGSIETMQNQTQITQIHLHVLCTELNAKHVLIINYTVRHINTLQPSFACFILTLNHSYTCGLGQKPGQTAGQTPNKRTSYNAVDSETGEWRVGQLRGTQSAEYALCGWSSITNGERPRKYILVLRGSLCSHSSPVTLEVSTPSLNTLLSSVLTAAVTNRPNHFWRSYCQVREDLFLPRRVRIYNIGSEFIIRQQNQCFVLIGNRPIVRRRLSTDWLIIGQCLIGASLIITNVLTLLFTLALPDYGTKLHRTVLINFSSPPLNTVRMAWIVDRCCFLLCVYLLLITGPPTHSVVASIGLLTGVCRHRL